MIKDGKLEENDRHSSLGYGPFFYLVHAAAFFSYMRGKHFPQQESCKFRSGGALCPWVLCLLSVPIG